VTLADVVLVVGYLLAVPFTLFVPGFLRLWRRRETWVFVTAQTGALLIVLGWAVKGDVPAAAVNAAWLLGLGLAWWREGRKRAQRPLQASAVGQRPQDI
jgi:uncharacterized membrane protein